MKKLLTAVSVIALMGVGTVGPAMAGGPPEGGYHSQTRAQMKANTSWSRSKRISSPRVRYFHGLKVVYRYPPDVGTSDVWPGNIGSEWPGWRHSRSHAHMKTNFGQRWSKAMSGLKFVYRYPPDVGTSDVWPGNIGSEWPGGARAVS